MRIHLALVLLLAASCQKSQETPTAGSGSGSGSAAMSTKNNGSGATKAKPTPPPRGAEIDSKDILDRTDVATQVEVKHVLIGWKELEPSYRGHMNPKAKERTNEEAAKMAKDVLAQLQADPKKIDELVKTLSEDEGSAKSGESYPIDAHTQFVPEFKKLALRLKPNEAGIVQTVYGYHVIERLPPDPLQSNDILARPAGKGPVWVDHVLIGWKTVPAAKQRPLDPRAKDREKAAADELAKATMERLKKGEDIVKVMKEVSEDPGSKDSGEPYEVEPDAGLAQGFKDLGLRLEMGEVGLVKTDFGWHVMKRVAAPPPDPLESADILKRTDKDVAEKVQVKHILLGWEKAHTPDPRGAKRTRAELEKLVGETLARLKKGEKIEDLMKELSEDGGSAKTGKAYPVTATAGMVKPFKNLSLRLKVGEVGVVKSQFGIHIIQRTE